MDDGKAVGFTRDKQGFLLCDELRVKDILDKAPYSPLYLTSKK